MTKLTPRLNGDQSPSVNASDSLSVDAPIYDGSQPPFERLMMGVEIYDPQGNRELFIFREPCRIDIKNAMDLAPDGGWVDILVELCTVEPHKPKGWFGNAPFSKAAKLQRIFSDYFKLLDISESGSGLDDFFEHGTEEIYLKNCELSINEPRQRDIREAVGLAKSDVLSVELALPDLLMRKCCPELKEVFDLDSDDAVDKFLNGLTWHESFMYQEFFQNYMMSIQKKSQG